MTKRVCISGYYGFDNFGDETILKILVENLKQFKNPVKITVLSVTPQKTAEKLKVESAQTFSIKDVFFSIYNSDCLISGGGSLLQDATSIKSLIYYLMVIALAQFFNKKVIIFAQGIGPIRNKFLNKLTMFLLKKADLITLRDEKSNNLLIKNGITNALTFNDPVWSIEVPTLKRKGKIGVQLRDFSIINDSFINKLAENINRYYFDKEIMILSLQNKLDTDVCTKLKNSINKINPEIKVNLIKNTSNDKVIDNISSLEALIGMRFHACLIAIKSGVKVLPVNYDIKVKTLAEDFNLECINSVDNMDSAFEKFANVDITYNQEKINAKSFDFSLIENVLD